MRTKTYERDGKSMTVETGFDEDGEAAIILTKCVKGDAELKCTLTLTSPAACDIVFDCFNENNVWGWPRALEQLAGGGHDQA